MTAASPRRTRRRRRPRLDAPRMGQRRVEGKKYCLKMLFSFKENHIQ